MSGRLLVEHEYAILAVLDEDGGITTGQVSQSAQLSYCAHNARMRSGAVRSWLVGLQREGLVAPLDDEKPICWVRTAAGTARLSCFAPRAAANRRAAAGQFSS